MQVQTLARLAEKLRNGHMVDIVKYITARPFQDCTFTTSVSSSALDGDAGIPPASSSKRTHLMMIKGVVTGIESGLAAGALRDEQSAAAATGRQLLMSKDGQATSKAREAMHNEDHGQSSSQGSGFVHPDSQLLEAALKHVAERGWSVDAVRDGAQDLGLSPSAAAKFERPEASLVAYFVERCNWELAQRLKDSKQELAGMKIQERVRTAIQWRLEMQIPYMDSWSQALAIRSSPGSLPATLKQVSNMVDEIWYGCGDTSADLSWYTKRATLADTWEALDRAMQDVAELGRARSKARDAAKQAFSSAVSILQQAVTKREAF